MVQDLDFPVEVLTVPTVREYDGLAMSSRNGYLSEEERLCAPTLYRVLWSLANEIGAGVRDLPGLERKGLSLLREGGLVPDYVSIRCSQDLKTPMAQDRSLVVLGAAWLGRARLIDNLRVER